MSTHPDDTFQLYDLRVELICPEGERILCGAKPGDHFTLQGEMLHLPPGQGISIYSLGTFCFHSQNFLFLPYLNKLLYTASALPLLAAKQRPAHTNDWMSTDAEIACPDPHCRSRLRIVRMGLRTFRHADVTAVPLEVQASTT